MNDSKELKDLFIPNYAKRIKGTLLIIHKVALDQYKKTHDCTGLSEHDIYIRMYTPILK